MPAFAIGDVTFDAVAHPAAVNHGCTKAQRDALADDQLVKVCDLAVKTNLDAELTKGLQVTAHDPSDLKDSNNFFNFVSQWETVILQMETHFKTHCMESPFTLHCREDTAPTEAQLQTHEMELAAFLTASAAAGGTPLVFNDGTNDIYRPNPPTGAMTIRQGANILRDWFSMTLQHVTESVALQLDFVSDATHRQNLVWSFQCIMDGLDADLKTFVLSKISNLDPAIGRTGPVAFMIVAQRILQTTENLAQKVINGFIALRLTHFEGENVIDAIFTLRNVLKFLRHGEANAFAPRTTLVILCDVFRGTSVAVHRAFVQQAQDIILKNETDPEVIFDHLQLKHEELLLADRWVPTEKKPAAFVLHDSKTRTFVDADKDKDDKDKDTKKQRPTHDKSGRKIDYTPPKNGESHTRTCEGVTEYWCGKCGRWGSHLTSKHDEWRKNFKKRNGKKNGNGGNGNPSANTATSPVTNPGTDGTTPRGSVTFLSSLTGNRRLQIDSELADGIDM